MVGTPYLCLMVVGFLVYRGLKRKHLAEQAALRRADGTTTPTEDLARAPNNGAPLLS